MNRKGVMTKDQVAAFAAAAALLYLLTNLKEIVRTSKAQSFKLVLQRIAITPFTTITYKIYST